MHLTPEQRLFAELILTTLKLNQQMVLTRPRSGKTVLFHNLEQYLRLEHKSYTLKDFEAFLARSGSLPNRPQAVKPFRPKIVNSKGFYLTEYYGISEERRLKLCELLGALQDSMVGTITSLAYRIDKIADFCDTAEEYTFCLHIDATFLEKTGSNLTS